MQVTGMKKVTAMIFVIFLFTGFIRNNSHIQIQKLSDYLGQDTDLLQTDEAITVNGISKEYTAQMPAQREWINLNGSLAKTLKIKGFYSDMDMYITDDLYIVNASPYTTTDYEYEQTIDFKNFLTKNGVNFLYVNEPTKYDDDSLLRDEFGVETYSNRNADLFLERIRNAGVNTIDLRENMKKEGITISDMFYRTDHHWTTEAGFWAAEKIAVGLNEYCGYHIDTALYNKDNYTFTQWQECWLGEQGRKAAKSYVGLDDYTEIKPNFATDYTFKKDGEEYEGTFDHFINEGIYNLENDVYKNRSWHYSYDQINCINNDIDYGKILIIGDSYEQVTEPFLSLGVHETDSLILRNCNLGSFDLRDYILSNKYDTVIVCYAQFMIGAHDKESSANYRMFTFE